MHAATLSEKSQTGNPKALCDELGSGSILPGNLVSKGDTIVVIPRCNISEVRGMFKSANTDDARDREGRL